MTDSSTPKQVVTESVILLIKDSPLVINSTSPPPAGTQGVPYVGFAFTASGGSAPFTWRVTSGALPVGLTLDAKGTLSGTPADNGSATFTVTAQDSGPTSQTVSSSFTLVINSSPFTPKELVANAVGSTAKTIDPHLLTPWGIVFLPGAADAVANNGTSTSTQYDGDGIPQPAGSPLVVHLPSNTDGTPFQPTGVVANSTPDFVVGSGVKAGPAQLIYAGASGMIAAWTRALGSSTAATTYKDTAGAVYTGLTLANNGLGNFLYAADFWGKKIDVFDAAFTKQTTSAASFSFQDPSLPAGYAPFGIQAFNNGNGGAAQLYVTYAQPLRSDGTPVTAQGLGLINIFDTNGNLIRHLVAGGPLNAPWGLALAPIDFGTFGLPLLVGNVGDGTINAFDPLTGALRGTLSDVNHNALSVAGLRGIAFGNDVAGQNHNTLFYAAAPGNSGVYGRIDAAYPLGIPSISFDMDCTPLGCTQSAVVINPSVSKEWPIAETQFFINGNLYRTVIPPQFDVVWPNPQVNSAITVVVIDVVGDVATTCQRYTGVGLGVPCSG